MPLAFSFLKSVTFVLAGRTTLSERRPTEHIDVDHAIAERSPYLRIYLPRHVRDDRPLLPIQLGDVDPAGFKLYIEWLTIGHVRYSSQRALRFDSCVDLIYAHIVGSTFSQPHFQDYIIDTLAYVLGPTQKPDLDILGQLFLEKHASSQLKRFCIDRIFAHERKMLSLVRNFVEDMVTGESIVKGCEYHLHDNEVCYKHGRVAEIQDFAGTVRVDEKKWTIDDDPELNAMATQYLGKTNMAYTIPESLSKSSSKSRSTVATKHRPFSDKRRSQKYNLASQLKRLPLKAIHTSSSQRQGSFKWSEDLKSPQASIRSLASDLDIDKPLPPTPLPYASSPPLPFQFTAPIESSIRIFNNENHQSRSTQDLVLECLSRLSPSLSRSPTRYLTRENPTQTPTHPHRPTDTTESPNLSQTSTEPPFPATAISTSSSSSSRTPSSTVQPVQHPYYISPSSPSVPHFPPLVKRKPAPPRGMDWLEQWDRLFALQGTQGFGLRRSGKRERTSWFMEILKGVGRKEEGGRIW